MSHDRDRTFSPEASRQGNAPLLTGLGGGPLGANLWHPRGGLIIETDDESLLSLVSASIMCDV